MTASEEILGRKVVAFMSDNHIDPDIAVEVFLLAPADAGRSATAYAAQRRSPVRRSPALTCSPSMGIVLSRRGALVRPSAALAAPSRPNGAIAGRGGADALPLAAAAFDLQSRLYNILEFDFFDKFGGSHPRAEEAMRTTLFRLAQYFGWTEILRRDIQF